MRPLPTIGVQSVGPVVFLDHFGPVAAPGGKLPAHPHAGIEVVTYLIDGANEHTDSLGNIGRIGPGGAQWMRAGRGIIHAERNLIDVASTMHGLQVWTRLPIEEQDCAPEYQAFQSPQLPGWEQSDARFKLLSGSVGGHRGPIPFALPTLLLHVSLFGDQTLDLSLPNAEHDYGVYGIAGQSTLFFEPEETLEAGAMALVPSGSDRLVLGSSEGCDADVLIVGGQAAPRPLHFGGSYVFDSREGIEDANRRFLAGEMGTLDGIPF